MTLSSVWVMSLLVRNIYKFGLRGLTVGKRGYSSGRSGVFRTDEKFHISSLFGNYYTYLAYDIEVRGRSARDRMIVGFTTTYAISTYHH